MDLLLRSLEDGVPRRGLLAAGLGLTAPVLAPPTAWAAEDDRLVSEVLTFKDPVEKLEAEFRLYRSLEPEDDVLLWYCWTAFIIADGETVAPFVRYEGIEFSHHKRIDKNVYRIHGHNLSFPRDLNTGAFLSEARNPITGEIVKVPPTVLTEDPGMIYAPQGKRPLNRPDAAFTPTYSFFRVEGDLVKAEQIRVPPDNWVKPFIETSHNWAPRAQFDDKRIKRLPMGTSGAFVYPFPRWLNMGERKGHMFGLWSGRKLDGVRALPRAFYDRVEREYPQLLKVDLTRFSR
jgi:hypothetical protein